MQGSEDNGDTVFVSLKSVRLRFRPGTRAMRHVVRVCVCWEVVCVGAGVVWCGVCVCVRMCVSSRNVQVRFTLDASYRWCVNVFAGVCVCVCVSVCQRRSSQARLTQMVPRVASLCSWLVSLAVSATQTVRMEIRDGPSITLGASRTAFQNTSAKHDRVNTAATNHTRDVTHARCIPTKNTCPAPQGYLNHCEADL